MPRILVLVPTSTYRATALNAAARSIGADLVVGSDRRQALEHVAEGRTLTVDFRDPEGATAAVRDFDRLYPLDAVVGVDDETTEIAARLAAALGLPGNDPESVRRASNKAESRAALAAAGIPVPGFDLFDVQQDPQGVATVIRFPCVIKPTFLSASRGVMRADDPDELVVRYHHLARILADPEVEARGGDEARRVLIEDYVPGAEVALEGLLDDGELTTLALFDKPDPLEGPFFEETLYVTPARVDEATRAAVEGTVRDAVRALGLRHGPVHAELRLSPDGPVVLEVAPRAIGGRCGKVLALVSGLGVEEWVLGHALGRRPEVAIAGGAGVMMLPIPRAGTFEGIDGGEDALAEPGVRSLEITVPVGERIAPPPDGHRYLGFLFASGDTPDDAERALRSAHRRLRVRIG